MSVRSTSTRAPLGTWLRDPRLLRLASVSGAALLFGALLIAVRLRWVPLEYVDHDLAADLNESVASRGWAVAVLRFVTRLGSYSVLGWLVAIAATLLVVRHRYRLALYLLVSGAGAIILDPTLKAAVGRLRPVVANPVAVGGGNSFPSGHSLGSIIVYGALVLVFLPALSNRARRPVIAAMTVLIVAIGFSRLALGVHFLSDVVGAWCLGVAWLGITAYAFELHRHALGRRITEPLTEGLEPEAAADLKPAGPQVEAELIGNRWAVPGTVVAWVLTFGALVAVGVPLARYRAGNGDVLWDRTVPHWLAAHRTPELNTLSYLGSQSGNTHAILVVGLIAGALALAVIRQWRPVVFLLVTMFGELTLFLSVSAIADRNRPDVAHLDGRLPTSSFPSGHVAATICLFAAIAILVLPRVQAWWRWVPVALAVIMPVEVALSRMYRGMHHPTDILFGSCVLAGGWLTSMVYLIRPNCDVAA